MRININTMYEYKKIRTKSRRINTIQRRFIDGKYLCCKCKQLKKPDEFYKNKYKWNKLSSLCKVCDKERNNKR